MHNIIKKITRTKHNILTKTHLIITKTTKKVLTHSLEQIRTYFKLKKMSPDCFAHLNQSEVAESDIIVTRPTSKEIPLPKEPEPLSHHQRQLDSINIESTLHKIEIDSFEILEQTIIKQKRLARLKNTDLRRKILLKRTFDLVCEIMDHENGFEQDSDNDDTTDKKTNMSYSDSSDSESSSSSSSESESDSDEEIKLDQNEKNSNLDELYSNLDFIEIRLEDFDTLENKPQAQVPVKRRASANSDSEEDYSDDESDDFNLKDQQLNTFNTNLTNLSNQLNLYNDNKRKKVYRKKRRFIEDQAENCLI
ncbi:unnamed protein product [Brachionus calyciflorus]|uniref:Uncharacterized protein n=1 Tax=Brachionus calyciflorus TaxID=104777 RepID=A0A813WJ93_9BILA|nr:unnamed protein product [Brachionus calyciflorus]